MMEFLYNLSYSLAGRNFKLTQSATVGYIL